MFGNDRTASGRGAGNAVQRQRRDISFYRTAGAGNIRAQQYFFEVEVNRPVPILLRFLLKILME